MMMGNNEYDGDADEDGDDDDEDDGCWRYQTKL